MQAAAIPTTAELLPQICRPDLWKLILPIRSFVRMHAGDEKELLRLKGTSLRLNAGANINLAFVTSILATSCYAWKAKQEASTKRSGINFFLAC